MYVPKQNVTQAPRADPSTSELMVVAPDPAVVSSAAVSPVPIEIPPSPFVLEATAHDHAAPVLPILIPAVTSDPPASDTLFPASTLAPSVAAPQAGVLCVSQEVGFLHRPVLERVLPSADDPGSAAFSFSTLSSLPDLRLLFPLMMSGLACSPRLGQIVAFLLPSASHSFRFPVLRSRRT